MQKSRIYVKCSSVVDKSAVRREIRNGVQHIIVASKTLPDDVVMNGILYPAKEIANGFQTLERTFAPIGHPVDSEGRFLPASDPDAIHNFHGGAFNENVRRENGRVLLDKVINVEEANKTERGRNLLERVVELETNENPRPIHTSTGLFLDVEELAEPQTNAAGHVYSKIGSNMVFDHDAILFDEQGAAVPEQGVGMAVNQTIVSAPAIEGQEFSHGQIREMLYRVLNTPPLRVDYLEEVYNNRVIYCLDGQMFEVPYVIADGAIAITDVPVAVETSFTKVNAMKDLILNALKEAKVETEGLEDTALLEAYNKLYEKEPDAEDEQPAINAELTDALAGLTEEVKSLKTQINARADGEKNQLADLIANSDKFPGLDAEAAKQLEVKTLRDMAASLQPAYGLPNQPLSQPATNQHTLGADYKMVE